MMLELSLTIVCLCRMQLACNAQIPRSFGGSEGAAVYIGQNFDCLCFLDFVICFLDSSDTFPSCSCLLRLISFSYCYQTLRAVLCLSARIRLLKVSSVCSDQGLSQR